MVNLQQFAAPPEEGILCRNQNQGPWGIRCKHDVQDLREALHVQSVHGPIDQEQTRLLQNGPGQAKAGALTGGKRLPSGIERSLEPFREVEIES